VRGRVLYKKLLVRPFPREEKTEGGIIKVWEDKGQDIMRATVVKAGNGFLTKDGDFVPLQIREGDVVHYHKNVGIDITLGGESYVLIADEAQVLFVEGE